MLRTIVPALLGLAVAICGVPGVVAPAAAEAGHGYYKGKHGHGYKYQKRGYYPYGKKYGGYGYRK